MPLFRHRSTSTSLLLISAGALTGLALGALLAERAGGLTGLLRGGGRGGSGRPRPDGWRGEERGVGEYMPSDDEDTELAPEAISHMHVRGADDDFDGASVIAELDALEERVLEAFKNDPILSERAIDIGAVDRGTVELSGWVRAATEIEHALTLARGIPGIQGVIDRLAVRSADRTPNHSTSNYSSLSDQGSSVPDVTVHGE